MIRDWDIVTSYIDKAGSTDTVIPFAKTQDSVRIKNQGNANLIYTIGSQSGTLAPGQSIKVSESINSFTIRSSSGTQAYEVLATEAGTEKEDPVTDISSQITSLTSQLAENMSQQKKLKESKNITKQLFVTLMDDDGRSEFMTVLKPVLDEYGIKMSLAINTGLVGQSGYLTWTQIKQLKAEGHEILNHTVGTNGTEIANKTIEQLKADFELEKAAFITNGLDTYDYMVYSGMMPWTDPVTRNKISEVYKCCFANTDAPVNYLPFDNYAIHRGSLTYLPIPTIDKYIDMGKGYLVLFQHSYNYGAPEIATLRTALDYLIQKGFTFVTAKTMVDNFTNLINLGNAGQDKFLVDQNGNVNFSIGGANINDLLTVYYRTNNFSNADISTYKKNSVTYEKVGGSYATYWLPEAGICKTFRFDDDRYAYREYTKIGTNEIWKSTYDNTLKKWIPFSPLSVVSATTTTLPKFIRKGQMLFVSNKPRWAQADGYGLAYTSVLRSTAYALGDIVNVGSGNPLYECVVAGITSDVLPSYTTTLNAITTDGTAQFKYFGDKAVYRDSTGTVVSP